MSNIVITATFCSLRTKNCIFPGFLAFSGVIEIEHWVKIGQAKKIKSNLTI